jgi:DNA invertase Pin-like site-specific DNA recombinase
VKAVGYARISIDQERGASLAAQRVAIEAEVARRSWQLVGVIEDAGISGRTLARPGLDRVLSLCRSGDANAVVTAKLDRISRSVVDFGHLLEEAKRGGWNIVALDFGLDLSTPQGELVANVLISVAQWERRMIGVRTSEALAIKRAQGVVLGRPPVLSDEVRERVRIAHARGQTLRAIAAELDAEGVPTAHGGCWRAETIRRIVLAAERRSASKMHAQDGQRGTGKRSCDHDGNRRRS